jgi:superkiller protein 3
MLGWNPAPNRLIGIINDMPQEEFEELTTHLLKQMRFNIKKQEFTSRHLDYEATRDDDEEDRIFLIRAVRGQKKIGPDELQAAVGKQSGGRELSPVYISTAGFTEDADKYADMLNISLADGEKLTLLLKKFDMADALEKNANQRVLEQDGDRFLPSIDELENNMHWGNDFYGTGNYRKAIEYYDAALRLKSQYDLAWLMKGNALSALGMYDEAIQCFKKVLEYNPESEEAWYNLGATHFHLGKFEDEIACYDQALALNPEYSKAWNNKGATLHHLGKFEEAILCYDRVLRLEPDNVQVLNNRGVALKNLENYEEALKSFDRALRKKDDYLDAWLNRGILLHDMERYQDAIVCYDTVLTKWRNPEVMLLRGVALSMLEKYMNAIEAFDDALSMKPGWDIALEEKRKAEDAMKDAAENRVSAAEEEAARLLEETRLREEEERKRLEDERLELEARVEAHRELENVSSCRKCGHVLREEAKFCSQCGTSIDDEIEIDERVLPVGEPVQLEEIEEQKAIDRALDREELLLEKSRFMRGLDNFNGALEAINEALGISERTELWVERGNVLAGMGRPDDAIDAYDRALKVQPDHIAALLNKETLLAELGEIDSALEINSRIIKHMPDEPLAWILRASLLRRMGSLKKSIECLDRAVEISPELAEVWNAQGVALLEMQKHEDAIICIDRAIQIDPYFAEAWANKGAVVLASGDADRSLQYFDRAVDIDPENAQAWANKGSALYEMGRFTEAVECLDAALAIRKDKITINSKGWALLNNDEPEKAIEAFEEAIAIDQNYAEAWNNLGLAYSRQENFAEAFDSFERALATAPDFTDARKNRDSTRRRIEQLAGGKSDEVANIPEPEGTQELEPQAIPEKDMKPTEELAEAVEAAEEQEQEELESEEFRCPHCGAMGTVDDMFCEECGQKFSARMKEEAAESRLEDLLEIAEKPEAKPKKEDNKSKKGKEDLVEELVKIPGLGYSKAQAITDAGFGTKAKLKKAKLSELTRISGISEDLAKKVKRKYK